jgi:DNA-3-methyladenine glycosylase II
MLVELPEPFSFDLTTERFRAFGPDPANLWTDGRLVRVFDGREVAIEGAPGGVAVAPGDAVSPARIRRFLGAGFDLDAFERHAARDPVLAALVAALRGLRPVLAPDPLEALVTSITAQQVSLRAASAIRARLVERLGVRHGSAWAFPTRERLAAATVDELRALGFSTRKAGYVVALARADLDLGALARLPDEEVKRELTGLPGLGEWTADWFLARHLGRPDAWPAGDLALRKAVAARYLDGRAVTADEVRAFGERFAGHRNLAAHYLLLGLRARSETLSHPHARAFRPGTSH